MFSFHWPHRLQFLHVLARRPLRHLRPAPARDDIGTLQDEDDDDRPLGCGWFDCRCRRPTAARWPNCPWPTGWPCMRWPAARRTHPLTKPQA